MLPPPPQARVPTKASPIAVRRQKEEERITSSVSAAVAALHLMIRAAGAVKNHEQ
jgi:hypothetical protein